MKTATLLLLFIIFIFNIFCNDKILSKFHQTGYRIKDVRTEIKNYSENYFYFFNINTTKYNRTTPVVNLSFKMKISVKDNVEVIVQSLKFLSNEYRHFPIQFQVNVQKAFAANIIGIQTIKNCGNITNFVFEKDIKYHGCNFIIDESRFPPFIPNGKYRLDQKLMHLNEEIAWICGYGEIYIPIEYPKN